MENENEDTSQQDSMFPFPMHDDELITRLGDDILYTTSNHQPTSQPSEDMSRVPIFYLPDFFMFGNLDTAPVSPNSNPSDNAIQGGIPMSPRLYTNNNNIGYESFGYFDGAMLDMDVNIPASHSNSSDSIDGHPPGRQHGPWGDTGLLVIKPKDRHCHYCKITVASAPTLRKHLNACKKKRGYNITIAPGINGRPRGSTKRK